MERSVGFNWPGTETLALTGSKETGPAPSARVKALASDFSIAIPIFFQNLCHAHGGILEPIPFCFLQVIQNALGLTLGAQVHICSLRAHRIKKDLLVAVSRQLLNIDWI